MTIRRSKKLSWRWKNRKSLKKRQRDKSRRDMRRANHDKITAPNLTPCPSCGEPKQAHRVCTYCGQYRGREVMMVDDKE